MPFFDRNGDTLNNGDKVAALGKVIGISNGIATVRLARQGNVVDLNFLVGEPVKATIDSQNHTVAGTVGDSISVNDDVLIVGEITALASGIHPVANVQWEEQGSQVTETFFCSELIKASVDGSTITGQLIGPG